ncbi:MAG: endonuclease V [Methanotrichaceae archaeon]
MPQLSLNCGISKNVLCGYFKAPVEVDEAKPLVYGEKVLGHVLKSKKGCRPIVVAPGHRVSREPLQVPNSE